MIGALYRPFKPEMVMMVTAGLIAATALYCVSYNTLAGQRESLGEAALWALINIVPWFLAFEAGKRARSILATIAALAGALAASLLLHVLAYGLPPIPGFELVRRLPGLLLVISLLVSGRAFARPRLSTVKGNLPLAPHDVDWVSAAGNYVELRSNGRTILHRAPLSQVQAELERHGFVRIHRSILVRRERIARVRPNDVILHDGTSLKTGKRYRSTLH